MKARIFLMRRCALTRIVLCCLFVLLGYVAGGCGAQPETATSEVPAGIQNMKDNMKNQMKLLKGAKGRLPRGGPGR